MVGSVPHHALAKHEHNEGLADQILSYHLSSQLTELVRIVSCGLHGGLSHARLSSRAAATFTIVQAEVAAFCQQLYRATARMIGDHVVIVEQSPPIL